MAVVSNNKKQDYEAINWSEVNDKANFIMVCIECDTVLYYTEKLRMGDIIYASSILEHHPKVKVTDGQPITCPDCYEGGKVIVVPVKEKKLTTKNDFEQLYEILEN